MIHILLSFTLVVLGSAVYLVRAGAWDRNEPMWELTESTKIPQKTPEAPDVPERPAPPAVSELPGHPSAPETSEDWALLLVNPWTPVPDGYSVTLTQLRNDQAVDQRCYPDLQRMMDDCRAAGLSPLICSSYRTRDRQEALFANKVSRLMAQGYSREEAEREAATVVALPGTSEHQTGLAVDIVDTDYQVLDRAQEDTAVQQWLMEHSWEYGFILRYPNDKSDVTGIIYEPWHYRYVGRKAAGEIHEQGVTLEAYLEGLPRAGA